MLLMGSNQSIDQEHRTEIPVRNMISGDEIRITIYKDKAPIVDGYIFESLVCIYFSCNPSCQQTGRSDDLETVLPSFVFQYNRAGLRKCFFSVCGTRLKVCMQTNRAMGSFQFIVFFFEKRRDRAFISSGQSDGK
jgi:hypothetical protein